jgi:hypothetical protein
VLHCCPKNCLRVTGTDNKPSVLRCATARLFQSKAASAYDSAHVRSAAPSLSPAMCTCLGSSEGQSTTVESFENLHEFNSISCSMRNESVTLPRLLEKHSLITIQMHLIASIKPAEQSTWHCWFFGSKALCNLPACCLGASQLQKPCMCALKGELASRQLSKVALASDKRR